MVLNNITIVSSLIIRALRRGMLVKIIAFTAVEASIKAVATSLLLALAIIHNHRQSC